MKRGDRGFIYGTNLASASKSKGSLPPPQESASGLCIEQMNEVHFLSSCFFKINFNIIFPSTTNQVVS
jgi:hypothetical protein